MLQNEKPAEEIQKPKLSTEEWLADKLAPVIAHELGHFLMIKILDKGGATTCTGHLHYTAQENQDWVDPLSGEPGTMRSLINYGGQIRIAGKVKDEETQKLISASGAATEILLGLSYKPLANYKKDLWETDRKVFKDDDEFATYVTKARAILEPYTSLIAQTAKRMAKDIAEYWGLGEYRLKISEKDILRYLEDGPNPPKNKEVEKIRDLFDGIAQAQNPMQALEKISKTGDDPLPKKVPNEWVGKMITWLEDPNPRISEIGNLSLTWYLMRHIPKIKSELEELNLDPQELFSICAISIQETLADVAEHRYDINAGVEGGNFYNIAGRKIRQHVRDHLKTLNAPPIYSGGDVGQKPENWEDPTYEKVQTQLMREDTRKALFELWEKNPRHGRFLSEVFGLDEDPLTCADIARREGITLERVRQIVDRALEKLKYPDPKHLRSYLD